MEVIVIKKSPGVTNVLQCDLYVTMSSRMFVFILFCFKDIQHGNTEEVDKYRKYSRRYTVEVDILAW